MKKIITIVISAIMVVLLPVSALAVKPSLTGENDCSGAAPGTNYLCDGAADPEKKVEGVFGMITSWALFFAGALAVIMIIVSSIKFVTSAGDAAKVASAKKMLTYSVIGLVIVVLAFPIVNWVRNEAILRGGGTDAEKSEVEAIRKADEDKLKKEAAARKAKEERLKKEVKAQ